MLSTHDLILLGKAVLAGFLGFIVGWERESHGHEAGIRTISLIAMGTTTFTAFAMETFPANADRIIANIITGIGFLGAGMILHGNAGPVRGLTTAASIWTVTSISILIGAGHYILGLLLTGLVLLLLWWQWIPWLSRLNPVSTQQKITAMQDGQNEEQKIDKEHAS